MGAFINSSLSLNGKTVINTRALDQQSDLKKILEDFGATVLDLPALEIVLPDNCDLLDRALEEISDFNWIIFSSSNGVFAVEKRLRQKNASLSEFVSSVGVAAVGKKTASSLSEIGVKADFVPPDFIADSLINNFPESVLGQKIFLPRVQSGGRNLLSTYFKKEGAVVVEVPAYESRCPIDVPEKTLDAILKFQIDAITFTSSKTVLHTALLMQSKIGEQWERKFADVGLISIGPQTSISCRKYFQRVDCEANPHDINGLGDACLRFFSN